MGDREPHPRRGGERLARLGDEPSADERPEPDRDRALRDERAAGDPDPEQPDPESGPASMEP